MIENLDWLNETVIMNEGFQVEESAALETMYLDSFEDKSFISEIDETRVDETAEIMAEVFPEEVLSNWSELSLDEKTEKLNEYYIRAGENLGINTKGVIVEDMPTPSEPGTVIFGYNSGDGYIHINEACVENPAYLGEVLDTATHEMRHQFQNDVIANPDAFSDIPTEVVETWEYEFDHYINPDYDFQGYMEQAIECDARDNSENVMEAFKDKLNLN